jgi:hypothetical protein
VFLSIRFLVNLSFITLVLTPPLFLQERCFTALQAIASELEAKLAELQAGGTADQATVVERALFVGRFCAALGQYSTYLPILLGPPTAWGNHKVGCSPSQWSGCGCRFKVGIGRARPFQIARCRCPERSAVRILDRQKSDVAATCGRARLHSMLTLNEPGCRLRQVGGFDDLSITWFTDLLGEDRANGPYIGRDERDRHGSGNFDRVCGDASKVREPLLCRTPRDASQCGACQCLPICGSLLCGVQLRLVGEGFGSS